MPDFCTPTDPDTAKAFLSKLHCMGLLYHPEDNAADCLQAKELTQDQLDKIQAGMDACFAHLDDPCEFALSLINPGQG